ncbi:CLUMA_CG014029, isoform A [Clunio marinus]|uniref:peptide chain release factor N(5)-glutamine methyltransferase n=1 Tax=Clunio marinus TaxID=568069 RepID=A0A1J1IKL0_9DIPT|nr:CLUMA_CG014029, isoform A [Clunio marinus]
MIRKCSSGLLRLLSHARKSFEAYDVPESINRHCSTSSKDLFTLQLKKFENEKVSEAVSSLELFFAHVLGKDKLSDVRSEIKNELKLNSDQIEMIESMCDCRLSKMPTQYILKEWDFNDLRLKMKIPVFIPRPETEELVNIITQELDSSKEYKILEVGCGTGCISLSLLRFMPNVKQIIAIDQSKTACELTKENSLNLELSNRLKVFNYKLKDDSLPEEISQNGPFDVIVSNPPYVPSKDLLRLAPEIFLYEDIRALDGGPEGLNIIQLLLEISSKYLSKNGNLWMEVDHRHPEIIEKLVENNRDEWNLKFIASRKDLFKKERFVNIKKL